MKDVSTGVSKIISYLKQIGVLKGDHLCICQCSSIYSIYS